MEGIGIGIGLGGGGMGGRRGGEEMPHSSGGYQR
jgi:hypothetical protein